MVVILQRTKSAKRTAVSDSFFCASLGFHATTNRTDADSPYNLFLPTLIMCLAFLDNLATGLLVDELYKRNHYNSKNPHLLMLKLPAYVL